VRSATRSSQSEPANGSPVCGVVAPGTVETPGGVELDAALDLAFTSTVTVLVEHVVVVHPGVPWLLKVTELLIVWAVVSVLFTTAWKLTETALDAPGWTTMDDQVTVPVASVTLHPGAPPQVAEPGT